MTAPTLTNAAPHVRTVVVYVPKDAPLGYASAEGTQYLPKSSQQAALRFPGGFRRVLVTTTEEEFP